MHDLIVRHCTVGFDNQTELDGPVFKLTATIL